MKRLLVVADHPLVFAAVRQALDQTAGLRVAGEANGRRPIVLELAKTAPDVVLIDEMQEVEHALARVREAADRPATTVIVLQAKMDAGAVDEVFEAGADAVLSRRLHAVTFATLLRETVRGTVVHRWRASRERRDATCPLTTREIEILGLVAHGFTNGRIARELWITEQTVKFHLSNCYRKLGVENRTQASRYAYANALVAATPQTLAS